MSGSESSALVRAFATDSLPLMLRAIANVGDRARAAPEAAAAGTDYRAAVQQVEQLLRGEGARWRTCGFRFQLAVVTGVLLRLSRLDSLGNSRCG